MGKYKIFKTKKPLKTERIAIRMTKELRLKAQIRAEKLNLSFSAYLDYLMLKDIETDLEYVNTIYGEAVENGE